MSATKQLVTQGNGAERSDAGAERVVELLRPVRSMACLGVALSGGAALVEMAVLFDLTTSSLDRHLAHAVAAVLGLFGVAMLLSAGRLRRSRHFALELRHDAIELPVAPLLLGLRARVAIDEVDDISRERLPSGEHDVIIVTGGDIHRVPERWLPPALEPGVLETLLRRHVASHGGVKG